VARVRTTVIFSHFQRFSPSGRWAPEVDQNQIIYRERNSLDGLTRGLGRFILEKLSSSDMLVNRCSRKVTQCRWNLNIDIDICMCSLFPQFVMQPLQAINYVNEFSVFYVVFVKLHAEEA